MSPARVPWRSAAALACILSIAAPNLAGAQARDWWDVEAEVKKTLENEKATKDDLTAARRKIEQIQKAFPKEGYYETYNPSVRDHFLPYFYLGWVNLRLRRFDDAEKAFQRSEADGYIKTSAPADLKTRFGSLRQEIGARKTASDALAGAQGNKYVPQCTANSSSPAGKALTDSMSKIDAILNGSGSAAGLTELAQSLSSAVTQCVTDVRGASVKRQIEEYQRARDAVVVDGIGDLLSPDVQKEFDAVLAAGKDAESKADEDGLKSASQRFQGLQPKVTKDVDARIASLAQDADRLVKANEKALNEQNQAGSRLSALAGDVRGQKAAGKSGKDLASVVKAAVDLKNLVASARGSIAPILQAKGGKLDGARKDFDAWAGQHQCEIAALNLKARADAASKDAAAARAGDSGDAMDGAGAALAALRAEADSKMKEALPRKQEDARQVLEGATSLLSVVPDAAAKSRGESLKNAVQQASSGTNICAIETAITDLNSWISKTAPDMERRKKEAVARNQRILDEGQRLLEGYAALLDGETLGALKGPVEKLASAAKTSYDPTVIDKAGQEASPAVATASSKLKSQMQEGLRSFGDLRRDAGWGGVSAERRSWLEQNVAAVERALPEMSSPELLARFAREYPRARLEISLVSAFSSLYEKGDAAGAAKTLEQLGPGLRASSAALNYSLSYVYWWQGQSASGGDKEAFIGKAKEAWDAGAKMRVDVASLGGPLFAPAFIEEMSRR